MTTYILIDTQNLFMRVRHGVKAPDSDQQFQLALHIVFNSIKKVWNQFDGTHTVFCLEGRSWRKDFYAPYKANRAVARAALTEQEQEEDRLFWETFDALKTYLAEKTNCTVLRHDCLEADDLVAGWIQSHPEDHHTIVSSDTDFHQLLAENVNQYNGIADELHTIEGIFDKKGRPVIDKKIGRAHV